MGCGASNTDSTAVDTKEREEDAHSQVESIDDESKNVTEDGMTDAVPENENPLDRTRPPLPPIASD